MSDDAPTSTPAEQIPAETPAAETPAEAPAENPAENPVESPAETPAEKPAKKAPAKRAAAKKTAAKKTAAKKTAVKKTTASRAKKSEQLALAPEEPAADAPAEAPADETGADETAAAGAAVLFQAPTKVTTRPARKKAAPKPKPEPVSEADDEDEDGAEAEATADGGTQAAEEAPKAARAPGARATARTAAKPADEADETGEADPTGDGLDEADADAEESEEDAEGGTQAGQARRRRRRGGRRRRKPAGQGGNADGDDTDDTDDTDAAADETPDAAKFERQGAKGITSTKGTKGGMAGEGDAGNGSDEGDSDEGDDSDDANGRSEGGGSSSSRRRRRRRRSGEGDSGEDDAGTVTRVRKPRSAEDEITSVQGSTRLEAKKQRRREGREAGRRRAPIVSEAEFLARRESVERVMAIRQRRDLTQIAVLEDKVLVEHYVAREAQTSLIGNVYLGRVQNVLPSMEAAFIDIGKGRNAVLYAGEVNWQALGHKEGEPRKIESVLQSGQPILVQVTKDPIGHKGARLSSQVSLAGRFLVYVPDGTTSGISRKLPDTERARLKTLLKEIVPESAGVIVRTAAEGASEDELTRDVERLKARWEDIEAKVAKGNAPQLLYGEPDLTLKVVRDLFTEDFAKLVIQGDDAWATVKDYVEHVAPDLGERLEHFQPGEQGNDLFSTYRIDEQIAKGLDRKVWLPSGGSLVIDRTEAMTVIDVNTGKFTGSGGNLEETVTKNNLEAAEEIVRQLRLRDIGGIIVVDFIDMVLESNRDLVLRRLVECLGRDRTRHQVAEVTSLGLVQMTRKRIGTGLVEAFSENCSHCQGRGIVVHDLPVEPKRGGGGDGGDGESRRGNRRRKGKGGDDANGGTNGGGSGGGNAGTPTPKAVPSPKDVAAMAKQHEEEAAAAAAVEGSAVEEVPAAQEAPAAEETPAVAEPSAAAVSAPVPVVEEQQPAEEPPAPVEPAAEQSAEQPAPVEPVQQSAEPAEPAEEPKATTTVVTRTRRRAASRPAGPPVGVGEESAGSTPADASPESADQGEPEPHVEHVPVKKKGTRKR